MKKTAKQKNGTIELMRFIFTSCILFFHISGMLWNRKKVIMPLTGFDIMFFRNGAIGVEFFFIVSGYLLAAGCFKKNSNGMSTAAGSLPVETGREIVRRGWKMWPYYFPACILSLITSTTIYGAISDGDLVKRIPAFFYLQELCLWKLDLTEANIILPAWYISSMLLSMLVLYPVLRRHYNAYARFVGPVIGCALIAYIAIKTGNLAGNPKYMFFTTKHNIRAFAELSIGIACFEAGRWLSLKKVSKSMSILISLVAAGLYGLVLFYACTNIDRTYGALMCLMLAVAVTVSFSEKGYIGRRYIKDSKLAVYLGSITLPIYLMQVAVIDWANYLFSELRPGYRLLIMYFGTILIAMAFKEIVRIAKHSIKRVSSN